MISFYVDLYSILLSYNIMYSMLCDNIISHTVVLKLSPCFLTYSPDNDTGNKLF